jgi:transcriptional regulator with XRE-family HTH domain
MSSKDSEGARLGKRLRDAREYLGYSQEEIATHLGIPRTALGNIEAGSRKVSAIELAKLAKLYRQTVSGLTGDEEPDDAAGLPADVAHLAREAKKLSAKDRAELQKYAEFLRSRSKDKER